MVCGLEEMDRYLPSLKKSNPDRKDFPLVQEIETYIQQYFRACYLPGLAVGLVKNNTILLTASLGVVDVRSQKKVTAHSIFHTASISKLFVATAVMQLVEKGKIALEDPPHRFLPYFKLADERYQQITIQQMLSHVSGIPDLTDYEWGKGEDDDGALERFVKSLHHLKLLFTPGQQFAYSNIAYDILGDLIAKVSGMPFEDYLQQNVLLPMGLENSTFLSHAIPDKLATTPHFHTYTNIPSNIYPYNRAHAPSSTLQSSIQEMCNFAITNLEKGVFNGTRILKEETCHRMWQAHALTQSHKPHLQHASIGWFSGQAHGLQTLSHSGSDLGYNSFLLLLPQISTGIVVLCNASPAHVENLALDLAAILLGENISPPQPANIRSLGEIYEKGGLSALRQSFHQYIAEGQKEIANETAAMLDIGSALIEMGQLASANDFIRLALEHDPQNAAAYELLAMLSFFQGDLESAQKYACQSLEINPNNTVLKNRIKMLA